MQATDRLVEKKTPYIWNDATETSFDTLKKLLITESLLQHPDFTRPFVLTTDASNKAIDAVLSQGPIGKDLRKPDLDHCREEYPVLEKELLAIVCGCKYSRQYLYGRMFTIVKDHRPLTWIFNVKDPSSRLL